MANFPTDWEVHSDDKFNMFDMDATYDTALGMNTLLKVGSDGRSTGVYKLYLFGGGTMESRFKLEDFIYNLPEVFEGLYIKSVLKAPRVSPGQNSCSTPWRDFDVLLLEKALFLVNEDDEILDPKELIQYLQSLRAEKSNTGASVRYAIAATAENRIQLEVQSLPGQAKLLNSKNNIRGDNAVSVLLGQFPVNADLFAGQNPGGPVPIFFAENPEQALHCMNQNPDALRHDIGLINSQILHMEHLSLSEAHIYVQSRARAAKGTPAFAPTPGPPPKKLRLQAGVSSATGSLTPFFDVLVKFICPVVHITIEL
jgi:hypothetical protein